MYNINITILSLNYFNLSIATVFYLDRHKY